MTASVLCRHGKTHRIHVEVTAVPQRVPNWKAKEVRDTADVEVCELCGQQSAIDFQGRLVGDVTYRMRIRSLGRADDES